MALGNFFRDFGNRFKNRQVEKWEKEEMAFDTLGDMFGGAISRYESGKKP